MAGPDSQNDEQTLPGIDRNQEGPHEGSKTGHPIHKKKPKANIVDNGTRIKIEGEANAPPETPHTKENDVYFQEMEMSETIHSNNTGPFPHTLQWGNKIVMVAVHLDVNYIFAEPMRNNTDGKQIHVYQKIIDRMRRAKLGLKKHVLDNKIW